MLKSNMDIKNKNFKSVNKSKLKKKKTLKLIQMKREGRAISEYK